MESRQLFMVSMHRSGSSILANWVKACGLDIGKRIPPPTLCNKASKHEDKDFLELHELLLEFNGATMLTGLDRELGYDNYLRAKAKSVLFVKNILSDQWGMKQPLASLFLDLWHDVNPEETYYISVVRDFWEVVSSMHNCQVGKIKYRYTTETDLNAQLEEFDQRKKEFYNLYLSMWIRYNQEIIQHYNRSEKGNHLVIWMKDMLTSDRPMFEYLTDNWGFNLTYTPISEVYNPMYLHKLPETEFPFEPELRQRAIETEKLLEKLAKESYSFLSKSV